MACFDTLFLTVTMQNTALDVVVILSADHTAAFDAG